MTTNDTLRGLLKESREFVAAYVNHSFFGPDAKKQLARIDAALAEPVSGGVVLLSDCVEGSHPEYGQGYFFTADAIRDVAALNGGAVAGQPSEVIGERCIDGGKCHHGCESRCFRRECCSPFSDYKGPWSYPTPICDCRQGRDACTCKPLESERGGE